MSVTPVADQLAPFIDTEKAVLLLLADLADGNVDIETPSDLQDHLPFVRVERLGGQGTRWTDSPRIAVDVFAARGSRSSAVSLAFACQARLLSFPHVIDSVGVIDKVVTDISPNEVPWPNDNVLLVTSSYQVSVRR